MTAPDATEMEAPLGRNETLIERLEAVESGNVGGAWRRNPDGPAAAARIRDLEAENARLRSAPQSGVVADLTPGQLLHELRRRFFNGGGWADYPEWSDYDEEGHEVWQELAKFVATTDLPAAQAAVSATEQPVMSEANAPIPAVQSARTVKVPPLTEDQREYLASIPLTPQPFDPSIVIGGPKDAVQSGAVAREVARMREVASDWRRPVLQQVEGAGDLKIFGDAIANDIDRWADMIASLAAPQSEPLPGGVGEVEAIRQAVLALCNGHPAAKIAWPHRELHAIADRLDALSKGAAR